MSSPTSRPDEIRRRSHDPAGFITVSIAGTGSITGTVSHIGTVTLIGTVSITGTVVILGTGIITGTVCIAGITRSAVAFIIALHTGWNACPAP